MNEQPNEITETVLESRIDGRAAYVTKPEAGANFFLRETTSSEALVTSWLYREHIAVVVRNGFNVWVCSCFTLALAIPWPR